MTYENASKAIAYVTPLLENMRSDVPMVALALSNILDCKWRYTWDTAVMFFNALFDAFFRKKNLCKKYFRDKKPSPIRDYAWIFIHAVSRGMQSFPSLNRKLHSHQPRSMHCASIEQSFGCKSEAAFSSLREKLRYHRM